MDEDLGILIENVLGSLDRFELEVDVEDSLFVGEVSEMNFHGDTMKKIKELRAPDGLKKMVLSCEDDFKVWFVIEGGRDEEPEISETVRTEQMGLID